MTESELHRRIKLTIARELDAMGYMTEVEVYSKSNNTIFDVSAVKKDNNNSINALAFEVYMTNRPGWWKERLVGNNNSIGGFRYLTHKFQTESFINVFNNLSGGPDGKNEVEKQTLIDELLKTGYFSKEDCLNFIIHFMGNKMYYRNNKIIEKNYRNSRIYEKKRDVYCRCK